MAILLNWGVGTEKLYENGLDRVVLYVRDGAGAYPLGVVWNGVTAVTESPGGGEPTDLYASNEKYLTLLSPETFSATVEAYTYPEEFGVCDGSIEELPGLLLAQQVRSGFGLAYRSLIGSEAGGAEIGYKIHLVYGLLASPSEKNRATINESPDAVSFSWEVTSTPVATTGYRSVSKIELDSTKLTAAQLLAIEETIYGDDTPTDARLPLPDEVISIITAAV